MPATPSRSRTPIFTPYLEMPHLEDYDLKIVNVAIEQENRFQFDDAELDKLLDPKIKAFFVVNPGNPSAMALERRDDREDRRDPEEAPRPDPADRRCLRHLRAGLPRSLLGAFPYNTIGVYSYSKYFGCTGWRLGVIAVHEDNLFDELIASTPEPMLKSIDKRYGALTLEPRKIRFIDRIVADSRDVALNHTAGLSLPQQVMMMLFSVYELMDAREGLPEGLHRHRQEAGRGDHRRPWHRGRRPTSFRLLLRPDRPRILGAQIPRRRSRAVDEGERSPARSSCSGSPRTMASCC